MTKDHDTDYRTPKAHRLRLCNSTTETQDRRRRHHCMTNDTDPDTSTTPDTHQSQTTQQTTNRSGVRRGYGGRLSGKA